MTYGKEFPGKNILIGERIENFAAYRGVLLDPHLPFGEQKHGVLQEVI